MQVKKFIDNWIMYYLDTMWWDCPVDICISVWKWKSGWLMRVCIGCSWCHERRYGKCNRIRCREGPSSLWCSEWGCKRRGASPNRKLFMLCKLLICLCLWISLVSLRNRYDEKISFVALRKLAEPYSYRNVESGFLQSITHMDVFICNSNRNAHAYASRDGLARQVFKLELCDYKCGQLCMDGLCVSF
jgi:hypothetical protein